MTGSSRDDEATHPHDDLDFRGKAAQVAKLEAEAGMLRNAIAVAALILMALQVLAANGIFAWYGLAGAWSIPSSAVTAWMGTTVIEVVSVVLVIVNHLFPTERRKYA